MYVCMCVCVCVLIDLQVYIALPSFIYFHCNMCNNKYLVNAKLKRHPVYLEKLHVEHSDIFNIIQITLQNIDLRG